MGVNQKTILLHKPYFLKVSTKGGGGQNTQNSVNVVYVVVGMSYRQTPRREFESFSV